MDNRASADTFHAADSVWNRVQFSFSF